ncbi:class I adenylate-forming enzyme family protein [Streptomyces exfoliatus]|uniref:Class I adenylate-forming enzyme family protein n=1 Tax=Streptomyces exfoliatus TaxID=1905 RepID=A0ABV3CZS0_STREX
MIGSLFAPSMVIDPTGKTEMSNLAANLLNTASRYPQHPAVRGNRRSWTYADLEEHSARVGGGLLAHGIRPGDRVALVVDDVPAFAALYYGVLRVGAVAVLLDPGLGPETIRHRVDVTSARVVFAVEEGYGPLAPVVAASHGLCVPVGPAFLDQAAFWPRCPALVRCHGDEAAVVLWPPAASAGGKDAQPLVLGHRTLRTAAFRAVGDVLALSPGDTLMTTAPIHSLVGQTCGLNATVLAGAGFVRIDSADANGMTMEIHRSQRRRGVTAPATISSSGTDSPGRGRRLLNSVNAPQKVGSAAD